MDTPQFIDISALSSGPDMQIRVRINKAIVAKYATCMETDEDLKNFTPIEVYFDEKNYWLADGHHRVEAAKSRGHSRIWANVRKGSQDNAVWTAFTVNAKHGLALTRADQKRAIEIVVKHCPEKSTRLIADTIGISHMTVQRIRESLATVTNVTVEKVVGKDGKTRPAKQKKKSTKQETEKQAKDKQAKTTAKNEKTSNVHESERQTEIVSFRQGEKEQQAYTCGVRFEPDPDDDFFDWITDEERAELAEMQKDCPNRLVPMIRNYTIQSIPEHDPQYLISCLFSLFQPLYRQKLLPALARKMFVQDNPDSVRETIETLHNEFQKR